jgi:acetolactate synthase-1/2/3 large subunit
MTIDGVLGDARPSDRHAASWHSPRSEYHERKVRTTVADLVVARLKAAGTRALFGVPGGGSNLDLVEAARRARLPFILTSTETGGAIAAQVQADLTGHPGACLTTLGPGVASAINGLACAWLERSPIVLFTDSHAERDHGRYLHQDLDHHRLASAVVKRTERLRPQTAGTVIDRAIITAMGGQPGPVHLDCPGDVLGASAPVPSTRAKGTRVRRLTVGDVDHPAPASALKRLQGLLAKARKPIVLVGVGARRVADARSLDALCRERGVPAMVTYKAKGVVPDGHPWFAGVFMNASIDRAVVARADLIIGLGLDPVELLPKPWPFTAPVVSLCPWPTRDGQVPFALKIVIEIRAAIDALRSGLTPSAWRQADVAVAHRTQLNALDIPGDGLTAQEAIRVLAARLAATHRLTVDAGAHMLPATMMWPCREPNGLLISNGLATMAFSLPAAIGSAVADPKTPVVAFIGDGGLLMCAGELLTAAREKLAIIIVVFNDASLSLIEIKQIARRLPPAGVALGSVDWATVATSMGVAGFRARTEGELAAAVAAATATAGPSLIDVTIDRSNYPATFRAIREN